MNVACSICLESFTLTSDIYTTPCGHVFHYECIQKWLERGNPNCSLCRQNCEINEIKRLHFSENEAALEENYVYTQLESENLKLQKEVNESKAGELKANKKILVVPLSCSTWLFKLVACMSSTRYISSIYLCLTRCNRGFNTLRI